MAFPTSPLSSENVLRDVHDPAEQRLRVDAQVTAIVENVTVDVTLDATDDNVAIKDPITNNILAINADGSINANVNLSHVDDSVKLGDGVSLFTASTVGLKTGLDINIINSNLPLPLGAATETTLSAINSKLNTTLNGVEVDAFINNFPANQNVTVTSSVLPTGAATSMLQTAGNASLASIDTKFPSQGPALAVNSIPVTLASDQPAIPVSTDLEAFTNINPDNVQLVGSIDGTKTGNKFGFVNNIRQQILAAHDRQAELTYADFGTKDQRITQIDYTSVTFPGITVRKQFVYTLVSGKYRRDDINWIII